MGCFGIGGNVRRASILDLADNPPLTVELVDAEDKLRPLVAELKGLSDIGPVTLSPAEVPHCDGSAPIGGA